MPETLPLAEVKAHLSELVARVHAEHERVTVTVHGKPMAVLVAVDDLESLEDTLEILNDPEAVREIRKAEREIAAGKGETLEQLTEAMRKAGRLK